MFEFDARTKAAVSKRDSTGGREWLAKQTELVNSFLSQRNLIVTGSAPQGLAFNQICYVEDGDNSLVLKTGYPEPELFTELSVLQLWQGRPSCVQLVDADEVNGIMLLNRIQPGQTFRSQPIESRSAEIPNLFAEVPMAVQADFPRYADWLSRAFESCDDEFLLEPIKLAVSLFQSLQLSGVEELLLHGDLHHENMLLASDGRWIAIDPKGVLGPRLLEYGRFMHNFMIDEVRSIPEVIFDRATTLAGEFSADQLIQVGFIDLILSCSWFVNDGEDLGPERELLVENYVGMVS